MIKVNITMSEECYKILLLFGTIDEVVQKALVLVEKGEIDLESCPYVQQFGKLKHIVVTIDNPYYESLRALYGATSPKASINRLLYYIVDNEIYEACGWKQVNKYNAENEAKIEGYKSTILHNINKLSKMLTRTEQQDKLKQAYDLISDLWGIYEREHLD